LAASSHILIRISKGSFGKQANARESAMTAVADEVYFQGAMIVADRRVEMCSMNRIFSP
jgi:hypothetical protein